MKKCVALILFAVLSGLSLFAQNSDYIWSLERCIQYALENNLQVKRQLLAVKIAKNDLTQSYYEAFPNVNAGLAHDFSSGRSLNIETYAWENTRKQQGNLGISSNLTLFKGLQNLNSMKYNKYSFLSSEEDLEKVKDNITLSITTAYLQVLFAEELLIIARNLYEITLLQVSKSSKMVEVGNMAKGELLQIKAQAASEKLNVATRENELNLSTLELTQLLDLDSTGNFVIVRPENLYVENLGIPQTVEDIFRIAITFLPQIKSSEYNVKMAERYLALRKGERRPSINLRGLYYSRYLKGAYNPLDPSAGYFYRDQLRDNQYSQLSVGLDIPIFNRMVVQTNISKAKIQVEDSKYALDQDIQALYKNIQQVQGNALAALEKYNAGLEAVASNKEAFKYTQQKFDVGLVNTVDYNISKNDLLKAESELLQAKYEFIFRMKIIDYYKGKEITL